MAQPIAVTDGIAFAFPNICMTPAPPAPNPVPIPYPSIADLSSADNASENVTAGGKGIILSGETKVGSTSGDEAGIGTGKGVISGTQGGECTFPQGSGTVEVNGKPVVRLGDPTKQNGNNADGVVLGGLATVLVGG